METLKILVTGATGFLGSHLCRALVSQGHRVTAFRRCVSDITPLKDLGLHYAIGDITDADAVNRAVQGHDAVIHAAAHSGAGSPGDQARVNVDGTRNVVDACLRNGVQRLIHISSIAAIGIPDDPNSPANEEFAFNLERSGLNYHVTKRRAEEIVLSAVAKGLNAVIINPGSIFGPFEEGYRNGALIEKVRSRPIIFYFRGGMSLVHVDDVVDGILHALADGRSGQRYILAGENLTNREIAEIVAQHLAVTRLFIPIPYAVSALAAAISEPLSGITKKPPLITYDLHFCANHYEFYDSQKAKTELGYNPRAFAEIVKEYLAFANK